MPPCGRTTNLAAIRYCSTGTSKSTTGSCTLHLTSSSEMLRRSSAGWLSFSLLTMSKKRQSTLTHFAAAKVARPGGSVAAVPLRDIGGTHKPWKIFCDLDGVLVDFDAGVRQITNGQTMDQVKNRQRIWSAIARHPTFWQDLPWTPDGRQLWRGIAELQPTILTGVLYTKSGQASTQKFAWCQRELAQDGVVVDAVCHVDKAGARGQHVIVKPSLQQQHHVPDARCIDVITCHSKNKHFESAPHHVLIDDRAGLEAAWVEKGGTFVWHTSTARTLQRLAELGIIPRAANANDSSTSAIDNLLKTPTSPTSKRATST